MIFNLIGVNLALSRDGYSGGYVRLLNITKDGYSREVIQPKDQPFKWKYFLCWIIVILTICNKNLKKFKPIISPTFS